jgi:hypothetical protein
MSRRGGRTTSRSALPWRRRKQRARHAGWPPPPLRQQQRVAGRDRAGFSGARRRWEPAPWPRTRGRCGGVGSGRRDGGSRGTCKATAVARGGASSQGEAANNPSRRWSPSVARRQGGLSRGRASERFWRLSSTKFTSLILIFLSRGTRGFGNKFAGFWQTQI